MYRQDKTVTDHVLRPWKREDADALRDMCASTSDLRNQIGDADLSSVANAENFIEETLWLSDPVGTKSHSRPRVTSGNSYSARWFNTLKFAPVFSEHVDSIPRARAFAAEFVEGHNHTRRHAGIRPNTPAGVDYGHAGATARIADRSTRPWHAQRIRRIQ
jgi:hypothetical protein